MNIFIVFRDAIYGRGLRETLESAADVEQARDAHSIALAWDDDALRQADVIVLDSDLGGAGAFVQEITASGGGRVLLCLREATGESVRGALVTGAVGVISRDRLTPATLLAAVRAVASGIAALDWGILPLLSVSDPTPGPRGKAAVHTEVPESRSTSRPPGSQFTPREHLVLTLVAAGLSNREIANRLSYSERTIKTVLHDISSKLGVKSRSHAVALAVREQMI